MQTPAVVVDFLGLGYRVDVRKCCSHAARAHNDVAAVLRRAAWRSSALPLLASSKAYILRHAQTMQTTLGERSFLTCRNISSSESFETSDLKLIIESEFKTVL